MSILLDGPVLVVEEEATLRARGESLRAVQPSCPDCGRRLVLSAPLDDRIHPPTRDARPLLLACELRPHFLAPHLAPKEGDGASTISYLCDWTRLVGWFARQVDPAMLPRIS